MFDPKAPSSVLALAEYKKPPVRSLPTKLAWQRAKCEKDAEDFLSDSLMASGGAKPSCGWQEDESFLCEACRVS